MMDILPHNSEETPNQGLGEDNFIKIKTKKKLIMKPLSKSLVLFNSRKF